MTYLEMHRSFQAAMRAKGFTEDTIIKRGVLFLHTIYFCDYLSDEGLQAINKHKINGLDIYGYLIPYHNMDGVLNGEYQLYSLGKFEKVYPVDPGRSRD